MPPWRILVFETGLPTRYYLPERDVDPALLADSDLQTRCPYKGFASYRDVLLNGRRIQPEVATIVAAVAWAKGWPVGLSLSAGARAVRAGRPH